MYIYKYPTSRSSLLSFSTPIFPQLKTQTPIPLPSLQAIPNKLHPNSIDVGLWILVKWIPCLG